MKTLPLYATPDSTPRRHSDWHIPNCKEKNIRKRIPIDYFQHRLHSPGPQGGRKAGRIVACGDGVMITGLGNGSGILDVSTAGMILVITDNMLSIGSGSGTGVVWTGGIRFVNIDSILRIGNGFGIGVGDTFWDRGVDVVRLATVLKPEDLDVGAGQDASRFAPAAQGSQSSCTTRSACIQTW
jgi:hypothetical protein